MMLSARNQLAGKVISIERGAVNANVAIDLGNQKVSSIITVASVDDLGLEIGSDVKAVVKSSSVMMMVGGENVRLSARNQLAGKVTAINEGAVNANISIDVDGQTISSIITMNAVKDLGLEIGSDVKAVIKSSSVMIMVG